MKVSVTTIALAELDVDLLLVPLTASPDAQTVEVLKEALGANLQRVLDDFNGSSETIVQCYADQGGASRVALLGLGAEQDCDAETLRRVAAVGVKAAEGCEAETVAITLGGVPGEGEAAGQALAEGFVLASYRFKQYKTEQKETDYSGVQRLVLHGNSPDKPSRRGVDRGRVLAEATCSARDLVNLSPNDKTPTMLAKAIERAGKKYGYDVSVWDKALIEEEKMGGLLAVNLGSIEPPTFTVMTWAPENAVNERPVVLVGKGIVFDTGGLSLKPTKNSMDLMKSDMAGAAAVIGAMEAIARLELPLYVVALIPSTDNRPGQNAYVPGDVIHMHSGKTVEVLNTDAEGRMVLADALSYAQTYRPDLAIDLATLTGAAIVALGSEVAAVMTNDREGEGERLDSIEAAGRRSGERVHRLPMYAHYAKQLESNVADLKNVGGREAGTITAGKFLEHFVDYPWIHLDIAGPAFLTAAKPYRPVGGSGFGVRLVVEFLRQYAKSKRR